MVVKLSALRAGRPVLPGRFLVLIFVRGFVDPRAIVGLEELGQLKNPVTSPGIEPATFQLVVDERRSKLTLPYKPRGRQEREECVE
jgi:hypothetical protein